MIDVPSLIQLHFTTISFLVSFASELNCTLRKRRTNPITSNSSRVMILFIYEISRYSLLLLHCITHLFVLYGLGTKIHRYPNCVYLYIFYAFSYKKVTADLWRIWLTLCLYVLSRDK